MSQNELDKNAKGGTELLGELLESRVDPELLQQVQIIRSRFRGFDNNKRVHIFWEHDLPDDPESVRVFDDNNVLRRMNAIVFVSYWQKQEFMRRFPKLQQFDHRTIVILNAIEPFPVVERNSTAVDGRTIKLIYTPTPHRGLELLVPVFERLASMFPGKLHLDVYSSFKLYGWEERDQPYAALFQRVQQHPNMTNHGTVSNQEIRNALCNADLFVYPSIWQETSCLCLIEAMSAGCYSVVTDLAALPETSGGLVPMSIASSDPNVTLNAYFNLLLGVIQGLMSVEPAVVQSIDRRRQIAKLFADTKHNSATFVDVWTHVIIRLLDQSRQNNDQLV